jgi:hydrogenase nickel incorporation protein HypA/HybF
MHELGMATALVEQVEEIARREGAARIVRIELVVGDLSGVDREALEFVFPFAAERTAAEGAVLAIEVVAGRDLLVVAMEVE